MAEYIEREAAIAWFMPYVHAGESIEADVIISDLKGMKADDVEPVVRCRECEYHNKPPCPMRLSFNWTEDDDFCSYGERKDGDK